MIRHRNGVAVLVTSAVGLVAAVIAFALDGGSGAASALLGLALAVGFLATGSIPFVLAGDTQHGRGGIAFVVLAVNYALRLVVALVVLKLASRSSWVHEQVVGITAIACAAAWSVVHLVLGTSRKHAPTLDL